MKTAEDLVTFSQANVEALVKSGQIVAATLQDLTKQMASTVQASMDETMATFRAMAGVRSIKEAIGLQTTLARSTVEKALAQAGQVAEASFVFAEHAVAPIADRMTLADRPFGKSI